MPFVSPPLADRGGIGRPADLDPAGRQDRTPGLEEAAAIRVPVEPAESQEPSAHALEIGDQVFVVEIEDLDRQNLGPGRHHLSVVLVEAAELGEIEAVFLAPGKVLKEAGQAGVQSIAAAVQDTRFGEQQGDQAQMAEVQRRLVGHDGGASGHRQAFPAIGGGEARQDRLGQVGQALWIGLGRVGPGAETAAADRLGDALDVGQLAGPEDRGMAGQDLLDQGGARARHPDDEDRQDAARPRRGAAGEKIAATGLQDPAQVVAAVGRVRPGSLGAVTRQEVPEGAVRLVQVVIDLAGRELEEAARLAAQAGLAAQGLQRGDQRVAGRDAQRLRQVEVGFRVARVERDGAAIGGLGLADPALGAQDVGQVVVEDRAVRLQPQGPADHLLGGVEVAAADLHRAQQVPGLGVAVVLLQEAGVDLGGFQEPARLLQRNAPLQGPPRHRDLS